MSEGRRAHPVARDRLRTQGITHPGRGEPADIVRRLLAVQAQDYFGAKWALGLRLKRATDASVEREVNEGKILRTHILRPTWHFVLPEDIRWLLALTAPRVLALNRSTSTSRATGSGARSSRRPTARSSSAEAQRSRTSS